MECKTWDYQHIYLVSCDRDHQSLCLVSFSHNFINLIGITSDFLRPRVCTKISTDNVHGLDNPE
jgi:hypothetical protein